jgi:hypothetical protein
VAATDNISVNSPRRRQIGTIGTMARVVIGLVLLSCFPAGCLGVASKWRTAGCELASIPYL